MNCYNCIMTIGSVESFTGGAFAATIVKKPGASAYFKGSIITYATELKEKLGIDISDGLVSKKTALSMAKHGKEFLDVDICVSFTGSAGPKSLDGVAPGNVVIAINDEVYKLNIKGSREKVIKKSVDFALKKIKKFI